MHRIFLLISLSLFATGAVAQNVNIERVVGGLDQPWAIGFLPDGDVLITERSGELLLFDGDQTHKVVGVPPVVDRGQGGLLDVLVPDDFAQSREIFLSYAKKQGRNAGTSIARAKLSPDNRKLTDVATIFELTP
ncbi:MAG: PQQ-dependent sugar dehydrogenase, partial [Boseongicola sp.]|nr:PQQ-dependent sugar dehydrogenase [Boseongicola sp.]